MNKYLVVLILYYLTLVSFSQEAAEVGRRSQVLYVDHEPGNYHLTIPQKKKFLEMAKDQGWEVTVMTGTDQEVIKKLGSGDYAKGYDIVVYNICVAKSNDLNAPYNIIRQTNELGVPALLLHGSLHSFWPTYKRGNNKKQIEGKVTPEGAHKKVVVDPELLKKWNVEHPNKAFPAWPNFTGLSSERHGPRKPLTVKALNPEHPILEGFKEFTTGETSELYNNVITSEDVPSVVPILEGRQVVKEGKVDTAVVLWEYDLKKAKTVSFTLGHDMNEWEMPEVQALIINSVKYLLDAGKTQ